MAFINRVSRLFRADLHAVIDRLEEPDVVLRQAVREMEEEVSRDERRLKLMACEQRQLAAREADLLRTQKELGDELDVCFDSNADELARTIIKRQLEAKRLEKTLTRKLESLEVSITALQTRLRENRDELDAMRQKAELLTEERVPVDGNESSGVLDCAIRAEDIEVAFLREKQGRRSS